MASEHSSCNDTAHVCSKAVYNNLKDAYMAIGVIFLVIFVFGVVFTSLLLYVFWKAKHLQSPSNVFIMGMIVADFLMLVCGLPTVIASCFAGGHYLGHIACQFEGCSMTVIGLVIICLLTAISIDRYIVISHYQLSLKVTRGKAVLIIMVCFLYGTLWGLFPYMGFGNFTLEKSGVTCGPNWGSKNINDRAYGLAMFVFLFFLPLTMMTFSYTMIFIKVKKGSSWRSDHARLDRSEILKRQIEVTVSIVLIVVTFIVCWLPYAIVSFWSLFNDIRDLSVVAAIFAPLMAKTSAVLNPLVYVIKNKEFRSAFNEYVVHKIHRSQRVSPNVARAESSTIRYANGALAAAAMKTMTTTIFTAEQNN